MSNIERRKRLRAGDTDRDAVLEVLHAAFAAGRLTPTDLADRQEAALAARYIDELPELVEDCPEGAQLVRGTPYIPASITARRLAAQCPANAEYF